MYLTTRICAFIGSLPPSLPSPSSQDLDHLEQIWELTQEWEMAWDSWKVGTFAGLQTEEMGFQAQGMLKKLSKLAREVKVRRGAGSH